MDWDASQMPWCHPFLSPVGRYEHITGDQGSVRNAVKHIDLLGKRLRKLLQLKARTTALVLKIFHCGCQCPCGYSRDLSIYIHTYILTVLQGTQVAL
jgi:hypothetical protein